MVRPSAGLPPTPIVTRCERVATARWQPAVAIRSYLANAEQDFDEDLIERLVEVAALRELVE